LNNRGKRASRVIDEGKGDSGGRIKEGKSSGRTIHFPPNTHDPDHKGKGYDRGPRKL